MSQNHWVETSGSIASPLRWLWPTLWTCGSTLTRYPSAAQALDDLLARLGAVEAGEVRARLGGHPAVEADDGDAGQVVPLPHLEVVGIVERGDLHQPGAELAVDRRVGHERQAPADQRQDRRLAVEMEVALVLGMEGDGGVAQHRLRPGGGDHDPLVAPLDRIGDVVELALHRLHLDLEVGDGGAELRRPVDHVLAAGDQPLAVEADEGLAHGAREAGVEGEALAASSRRRRPAGRAARGCCRGTAPSTPTSARGSARAPARGGWSPRSRGGAPP